MIARVTPIRPGIEADSDDAALDGDWLSTEASIAPDIWAS
jgi:hypothetical protein